MDFTRHQNDLRAQRRVNGFLGAIVAGQSLTILLCLFVIVSILGSDRTLVVPPSIEKSFWVSRDKVSREYLEEMAAYVSWLVLDVTPSTIDWKRNALLDWASPTDYAELKRQMDIEADRLRRNNATTSFLIQQLVADETKQAVVVTGRLRRQINGADVGDAEPRSYRVQFKYAGGRTQVESFKEVAHAQGNPTRVARSVGPEPADAAR